MSSTFHSNVHPSIHPSCIQGVNEFALMEFFNKTMVDAQATVMEGKPILNVEVNLEKNFAFLEFRTPEEASACIHFDGISYDGHTLRIRRPKDYAGGGPLVGSVGVGGAGGGGGGGLGMLGMQVPDTPNKVFVGGLPPYFAEDQVRDILLAVGPLKHFSLIRDQVCSNTCSLLLVLIFIFME
jgi:splicing factor U2AF subunit